MSTAVMSSSPLYDFGEFLYKSHANNSNNNNNNNSNNNSNSTTNNNNNSNRATATTTTTNINMSSRVLRWGSDTSQRAVGGPVPLGRRSSNPGSTTATATFAVTASLVSSVSTLILDNMAASASASSSASAVVHRKLDRSQSEPASVKAANINTSRYKTELCRPFEENGSCKYGDKCQFAHGAHELRNLVRHPKYKTELCRTFHTIGFCPYGPRCHFIHNADEARNKPKPLELASTATESSPTSSLSQSPTNSVGSFFSETDVFSPQPQAHTPSTAFAFGQSVTPSPPGSPRGSPPPVSEARLPVFNRLSSQLILSGLGELLA